MLTLWKAFDISVYMQSTSLPSTRFFTMNLTYTIKLFRQETDQCVIVRLLGVAKTTVSHAIREFSVPSSKSEFSLIAGSP